MKIGIYNLHMQARGGGEKKTLVMADHLSRTHRVWLFVNEAPDVESWEDYFRVDLSNVRIVVLDDDRQEANRPVSRMDERRKVLARLFGHFRQIKRFGLDLFINNSFCSNLPCPAPLGIYMCMFPYTHPLSTPTVLRRAYRSVVDRLEERVLGCRVVDFLSSYATVTAVSHFTASWIDEMWHRNAEIIYSVCENMGPPAPKEKIILHVGRFIAVDGQLFKRQDVLLEVFQKLRDIQEQGWQLCFVGSVAPDHQSTSVVESLKSAAAGLPVHFYFDVDFESLKGLYRRASLYWHATGYGVPSRQGPRAQEHFGNTTVEAMTAGAVPIVINSGGQNEIVDHGADGFLWDDLSQLAAYTTQLTASQNLLTRMGDRALAASARFGRLTFNQRMDAIIAQLAQNKAA